MLVAELLLTGACKYNNIETVGSVLHGREFNIGQDLKSMGYLVIFSSSESSPSPKNTTKENIAVTNKYL